MATVSRFSAVAKVGRLEVAGIFAWLAWLLLHLVYLVGFKSKVTTVISWAATFLTMNRGQLTVTEQQVSVFDAPDHPETHDRSDIPDPAVDAA